VPSPVLDKEKMILFCGRFENWSKRIDRLLRIWAEVQDRMPEWRLVLVGDGPDMGGIRELAERLALKRISFEGRRSDVFAYYDRASVVCLTSQTEGWPLALSEGQARGCIGVAFGCTAGVREILSPSGENGYIVRPFDEKEFATALLEIASSDEDALRRIRINGMEKRRQYLPEIIAQKWKVLFDKLMHNEDI
jgi:glycosyltransferase involved in cell wall biosynthesis